MSESIYHRGNAVTGSIPEQAISCAGREDNGKCAPPNANEGRDGGPADSAKAQPAHVIAGARLTCLIINAHQLLCAKYSKCALWCLVTDLTGHGSTVAAEICQQAGLDPHQSCSNRTLRPK